MDVAYPVVTSPLADVAPVVDVLSGDESSTIELLNIPSSKDYISRLATLPLTELSQEPTTLQTQCHHLTSSLTSFTHTSYPAFISLHKSTTSFESSIESLSSSLNILLDTSLPVLEDSTDIWKDRIEAILHERNEARAVLEQHEKIRDLLDIPVLIDTCVRNGYFGEALSLASHVASLIHQASSTKDNPPPVILTSVLAEVQHSVTQMQLLLLTTLYEPNKKLPALWKAVNFLRKMDAFVADSTSFVTPLIRPRPSSQRDASTRARQSEPSEPSSEEHLALAFLIGREACLKATLEITGRDIQRLVKQADESESDNVTSSVSRIQSKETTKGLGERDKEDFARYLKKYIDAWRESVYDIMTQYVTIFLERSPTRMGATINMKKDDILLYRLHTLLRAYSTRALSMHLLAILKPSLSLLTLSHLPSLRTQLTYCSTAFSQLGLDFRCMLVSGGGLFSTAILSIVRRDFETAAEKWENRIGKAYGMSINSTIRVASASSSREMIGPAELPSKWLVSLSASDAPPLPPSKQASRESGPVHIPPQLLSSYPPLAQLTNAVLSVFNGLRLVALRSDGESPLSVEGFHMLLKLLDSILSQLSTGLLNYLQFVVTFLGAEGSDTSEEKQKAKEKERGLVVAVGRAFFEVVVVFVRRALVEGVYGLKSEDEMRRARGGPKGESWVENKRLFESIVRELSSEEKEEEGEEEEEL